MNVCKEIKCEYYKDDCCIDKHNFVDNKTNKKECRWDTRAKSVKKEVKCND